MASVTCGLIARDRCQFRNPTLESHSRMKYMGLGYLYLRIKVQVDPENLIRVQNFF